MQAIMKPVLSVSCPNGTKKENSSAVRRMTEEFMTYVSSLGVGGKWQLELHKKTGGGIQERCVFRREYVDAISGGRTSLMFLIRPFDRDTAWLVVATSDEQSQAELLRKIKGTTDAPEDSPEKMAPIPAKFAVNQRHPARVVAHSPNGLEVMVEDKYPGFIHLSDLCNGKPDRKEMNRFPVGKRIPQVVICDISGDKIICSTRVEGTVAAENPKDVFTGIPGEDGILRLSGFAQDVSRRYDLMEWIAMHCADRGFEPIPDAEMLDIVARYMKDKYSAPIVTHTSIAAMLRSFYNDPVTAMLSRGEHAGASVYKITDFAWAELGGRDKFTPTGRAASAPPAAEPFETDQVSDEDLPPAPLPQEPMDQQATVGVEMLTEFLGKMIRLAEVTSQIDAAIKEKAELERWLEERASLKEQANALTRRAGS